MVGRDGGGPVVRGLVSDGDWLFHSAADQENLKMLSPAALPRPPDVARRVGCGDDVDIGPWIGRTAFDRRPLVRSGIVRPAVNVPVALDLLAPGDPNTASAADGHCRLPKVQERLGDGHRSGPTLAVEMDEEDLVAVALGGESAEVAFGGGRHIRLAAALIGDVGKPDSPIGRADGGWIIVLRGCGNDARCRGKSYGSNRAIEILLRFHGADLAQEDRRFACLGVDFQRRGVAFGLDGHEDICGSGRGGGAWAACCRGRLARWPRGTAE